jgi:hypothetical protein
MAKHGNSSEIAYSFIVSSPFNPMASQNELGKRKNIFFSIYLAKNAKDIIKT